MVPEPCGAERRQQGTAQEHAAVQVQLTGVTSREKPRHAGAFSFSMVGAISIPYGGLCLSACVRRALQALRYDMKLVIDDVELLERPCRLDHIVAVVAGPAMALAYDVQLPVMGEPSGVLRMAAVDRVAQRLDAAVGLTLEPDAAKQFPVYRRGLL